MEVTNAAPVASVVQATRRDSFSVKWLSLLICCVSLTTLFGLALVLSIFTASTNYFSLFPAVEAQIQDPYQLLQAQQFQILQPNLQQFQFQGSTMASLQPQLQPYSPSSSSYSYFPNHSEQPEQEHEPLLPTLPEQHQQPQTFPIQQPQLEQLSPTIPPNPSFVNRDNTDTITPLTPPSSYPNIPRYGLSIFHSCYFCC